MLASKSGREAMLAVVIAIAMYVGTFIVLSRLTGPCKEVMTNQGKRTVYCFLPPTSKEDGSRWAHCMERPLLFLFYPLVKVEAACGGRVHAELLRYDDNRSVRVLEKFW